MKRTWFIVYDVTHKEIIRFGHGDADHLQTFELGPFAISNGYTLIDITDQMEALDPNYIKFDIASLPQTNLVEQLPNYARFDGATLYIGTSKLMIEYKGNSNKREPVTLSESPVTFTVKKVDLNDVLITDIDKVSVEVSEGSVDIVSKNLVNGEITFTLTLPSITEFPHMVKVSVYSDDLACSIATIFFNIKA